MKRKIYMIIFLFLFVLMSRQGRKEFKENIIKQKIVNIVMKYHGCVPIYFAISCTRIIQLYNVDGIRYYYFIFLK